MFELPEYLVMAADMNSVLQGKRVRTGELGNQPHKFVWYNRTARSEQCFQLPMLRVAHPVQRGSSCPGHLAARSTGWSGRARC
jgi:hypothetical protein